MSEEKTLSKTKGSKYRKDLYSAKRKSKLFEECTNRFISAIEKGGYHVEGLIRSGGYFIFNFGGNSVNTFKIKEIPNWRFGLWWTFKDEGGSCRYVIAEFFTQFEKDIDKFKPSESIFLETRKILLKKGKWETISYQECAFDPFEDFYDYRVKDMLDFIKKHPYRAWARSSCWEGERYRLPWSGLRCWIEYHKNLRADRKEQKFSDWANGKLIKWLEKNVLKFYKGSDIYEYESMSPKYEIYAPLEKNRSLFSSRGLYGLFLSKKEVESLKNRKNLSEDLREFAENSEKLEKKFEKLNEKFKKIARRKKLYYFPEIRDNILILTKKGYERFKNKEVGI